MKLPIEEIAAINAELQIELPLMKEGSRVYVASPLSAPTKEGIAHNMARAKFAVEYLRRRHPQYRFVAPHTFFPCFLDDNVPEEREFGVSCGTKILALCSALLVFGPCVSQGMEAEIKEALRLGIPIVCQNTLRPLVAGVVKTWHAEIRQAIAECKNMDVGEALLRELCPELGVRDDRPACGGGWNNATAAWDAECLGCPAWMLNQKQPVEVLPA